MSLLHAQQSTPTETGVKGQRREYFSKCLICMMRLTHVPSLWDIIIFHVLPHRSNEKDNERMKTLTCTSTCLQSDTSWARAQKTHLSDGNPNAQSHHQHSCTPVYEKDHNLWQPSCRGWVSIWLTLHTQILPPLLVPQLVLLVSRHLFSKTFPWKMLPVSSQPPTPWALFVQGEVRHPAPAPTAVPALPISTPRSPKALPWVLWHHHQRAWVLSRGPRAGDWPAGGLRTLTLAAQALHQKQGHHVKRGAQGGRAVKHPGTRLRNEM